MTITTAIKWYYVVFMTATKEDVMDPLLDALINLAYIIAAGYLIYNFPQLFGA